MKLITFICVTILSCESFVLPARTQSNTKVAQCSGSIAQQGDKEMRFNLEWSTDSDLSAVVLNLSSYINRSDWIGIKLLGDIDNVSKYNSLCKSNNITTECSNNLMFRPTKHIILTFIILFFIVDID